MSAPGRFTPFSYFANATGQPAMAVPTYWTPEGLPDGNQYIGRFGDEATLFRLASRIEAAADRGPRESQPSDDCARNASGNFQYLDFTRYGSISQGTREACTGLTVTRIISNLANGIDHFLALAPPRSAILSP